jgi:NADH-quinone oxidoreductase subunit I
MSGYLKGVKDGLMTTLIGMRITWGHLFTKKVTIQYPTVKRPLPERARNRLNVNIQDCIGCEQCSKACPVDCIDIETIKALPTDDLGVTSVGSKKRLYLAKFNIDIAKCCFCGLCTFPCPTGCIAMTRAFEYSEYDRSNLVYHFSVMTPDQVAEKKAEVEQYQKEQEAKKAAAAAAAAEAKKKETETAAQKPATDAPTPEA